uniref:Uncharacterized protein n=1 Tax=Arion vulgaris TaxID=1028688 RepID=A0A0B7BDB0_9EUPU
MFYPKFSTIEQHHLARLVMSCRVFYTQNNESIVTCVLFLIKQFMFQQGASSSHDVCRS